MRISEESRIVADAEELQPLARILSAEIATLTNLKLKVTIGASRSGDIVLKLNPTIRADDQILAWWFTFTPDGQQAWFGNVGTISGDTATIAAVQTEGGRWIPNFDPGSVTQPAWGTLTFQFTDCNHGEVSFATNGPYGSNHMDLTRLTQPAGLACP